MHHLALIIMFIVGSSAHWILDRFLYFYGIMIVGGIAVYFFMLNCKPAVIRAWEKKMPYWGWVLLALGMWGPLWLLCLSEIYYLTIEPLILGLPMEGPTPVAGLLMLALLPSLALLFTGRFEMLVLVWYQIAVSVVRVLKQPLLFSR